MNRQDKWLAGETANLVLWKINVTLDGNNIFWFFKKKFLESYSNEIFPDS